jgi:hypothetical protein
MVTRVSAVLRSDPHLRRRAGPGILRYLSAAAVAVIPWSCVTSRPFVSSGQLGADALDLVELAGH